MPDDILVSYEVPTDREDLSDVLGLLKQYNTPLLDKVMANGMAARNVRTEWVNTPLYGHRTTLLDALTANSGDDTFEVSGFSALGIPTILVAGSVIEIGNEQMYVLTSTRNNSGNFDIEVERATGGTTLATHSVDDLVEVISRATTETNVPGTSEHQFGAKDFNITQILHGYVALTATSQAIDVAGRDNNMAVQIERTLMRLRKDLERQAIRGFRHENISGDRRQFQGLAGFLQGAEFTVDAGGSSLSTDFVDFAIRDLQSIGAMPDIILCSQDQKLAFNALKVARVEGAQSQSDKSVNNLVDVYHSELGPLPLVVSTDVRPGEIFILDTTRINVVPLQRRAFSLIEQGKQGSMDRMYIEGEYTMVLRNPEAHRRITDLAVLP